MASGRLSKVQGKVLDIPTPPTIGTATAGGESVSIAFTADSSGKGGPTRSYIAKSNPGNITATGSTSPISVTGLTVGTSYTISVAGVNETGTGEYSSASGSAVPIVATAYESISTVTVGSGGAANVEFTSIPSTYTHLQIRAIHRSEGSGTGVDWLDIRFNSDSGSNYAYHYLIGDGGSAFAGANSSQSKILNALGQPNDGQPANVFGATVIDILDYASTTKNKTVRTLNGLSNNQSSENFIGLSSGLWINNTTAISSISLFNNTGGNDIAQYSSFALYGIKGS